MSTDKELQEDLKRAEIDLDLDRLLRKKLGYVDSNTDCCENCEHCSNKGTSGLKNNQYVCHIANIIKMEVHPSAICDYWRSK